MHRTLSHSVGRGRDTRIHSRLKQGNKERKARAQQVSTLGDQLQDGHAVRTKVETFANRMVAGLKKAREEAHPPTIALAAADAGGRSFFERCRQVIPAMSGLPVNLLLANAMKDYAADASRNSSFHMARTYRKVSMASSRDCVYSASVRHSSHYLSIRSQSRAGARRAT